MIALNRLFDAHGGVCTYCGCETYLAQRAPRAEVAARFGIALGKPGAERALRRRRATREHIVRIVDGGAGAASNLTLACAYCNVTRGDAAPEDHRQAMHRAIAAGTHPNHADVTGMSRGAQRRARRDARLGSPNTDGAPVLEVRL